MKKYLLAEIEVIQIEEIEIITTSGWELDGGSENTDPDAWT